MIKVHKKIFLFLHGDAKTLRVTTKLSLSYGAALLAPFAKPTGYGLGKCGWVTASFAGTEHVPYDVLLNWMDESYRAIAPKRLSGSLVTVKKAQNEGPCSLREAGYTLGASRGLDPRQPGLKD